MSYSVWNLAKGVVDGGVEELGEGGRAFLDRLVELSSKHDLSSRGRDGLL